jgi:hypothetical protein
MLRSINRGAFRGRAVAGLLTLVTVSCGEITGPFPQGAVLIDPPRVYEMWWRLTESCSGITGDYSHVRWFQVPNASEILVNGRPYQGYWTQAQDRIVIEMLHALTGEHHTHEYFMDKCGGVVACQEECLTEAGDAPPPPADAPTIDVSDLTVESHLMSSDPSIASDTGWAAITITARNPRNEPVWVSLRSVAPTETASATFGYDSRCISGECGGDGGYNFIWENRIGFAAGQTRRFVFDRVVRAGTYAFRGFFNADTRARRPSESPRRNNALRTRRIRA